MNLRDPFRFRAVARIAERPMARSSVRMIQLIGLESQRSRLPQMAAALSYRTVFGLLPMVVVALVALRFFVSDAQIDQFVSRTLSYAGLEAIVVEPDRANDESSFWEEPEEETAAPPVVVDPQRPGEKVDATITTPSGEAAVVTPADVAQSELAETVRSLIIRAKTIDYRAVSAVGAVTLIYAAISMLTEIERAFNQIFRVPIGKPWRRRMTEYWALLTLGTPCLLGTFYVGERAKQLVGDAGQIGIGLAGFGITVMISSALLVLAYTLLPNTRVKVLPAILGALLAAIMWEAGKWGFTQYVSYSATYSKLYGSIALIPLFLLWIYATWVIVLVGLHVTYYVQKSRDGKPPTAPAVAWSAPPSGVVDPATAVAIIHAAARGFMAGKPVSINSLVETTRAQGSVVVDLVSKLVDEGYLYRVAAADDQHSVAMAIAPERVRVRDVLELGYELTTPTGPVTPEGGTASNGEAGTTTNEATGAPVVATAAEGIIPGVRARLRDTHLQAAGAATIADLLVSTTGPLGGLAPGAAAVANNARSETLPGSTANAYPRDSVTDTLPLVDQGESDRDQETDQDGIGGDSASGADRSPRVL